MIRSIFAGVAGLILASALAACASDGLYEPVYDDGIYDAAQGPARERPAS